MRFKGIFAAENPAGCCATRVYPPHAFSLSLSPFSHPSSPLVSLHVSHPEKRAAFLSQVAGPSSASRRARNAVLNEYYARARARVPRVSDRA